MASLQELTDEVIALRAQVNALLEFHMRPPFFSPGITDRNNVADIVHRDASERPAYAFGMWLAAVQAIKLGLKGMQVFEFGVAYGHGLRFMDKFANMIAASTDLDVEVYGFDSEVGMPQLLDYRDHPEIWHQGQFFSDHEAIRAELSPRTKLISGNIREKLPEFVKTSFSPEKPVGMASIDVDLYCSAKWCLPIYEHPDPTCYLPATIAYFDDINDQVTCNDWTGEELAIKEFNLLHRTRKLQEMRIRQNHPPRGWHDHVYGLHILDHPARNGKMPEGLLHNLNHTAM